MLLPTGTKLGSYEIIATLGAGGMGQVYRARDRKLGREVAIKVILDAFVSDRERLARFEREARALAALNHQNVATLYGMEQADGRHFLVMELVDGPTLQQAIGESGLDVGRTIHLAVQIAEGLEAAHEKDIVHRDLKPANIKIAADDKVKVLDFGLATSGRDEASGSSASPANSPTLTAMGTQAGVILGTASYMSPEQARGMAADHRSDIFSFGVVLYEMLSGRQPFQGQTVSDVLASVLAREPDLSALPPDLAPRLSDLVKRCLEKHPRRRWQAIGDVRHELELIAPNPRKLDDATNQVAVAAPVLAAPRPLWRRLLPVAAAIVITAGVTLAATMFARPAPPPAQVSRFAIPFGEGLPITIRPILAISPDGTRLAYVSNRKLLVREIAEFDARTVAVTASTIAPITPVFSPQGTDVAYFDNAEQAIRRVPITGGPATTICRMTEVPNGLTWSGDVIYFPVTAGMMRVAAAGGSPELVIKQDPDESMTRPHVLEGGRLLFSLAKRETNQADRWLNARIVVQRPGEANPTTVLEGGSDPRYLSSGHLVYLAGGVLYGRRFDPSRLASGPPVPLVHGIFRSTGGAGAGLYWYSVAENGTLVYQPGAVGASGLTKLAIAMFERDGKVIATKIPPGPYWYPRLSPDGQRIAYGVDDGRDVSVWVYDVVAGGSPRRLTFGGRDGYPAWTSDSRRVIFQSDREGDLGLYAQPADGSGTAVRLTTAEKGTAHVPQSVSHDGSVLLFDETKDNRTSLKAYSFKGQSISSYGNVQSMMPTGAVFSPNGRWVAYALRDERQSQSVVIIQPYPATGVKYQISPNTEDGHHQVWSRDGKELFYTPGPGTIFTALAVNTAGQPFSFAPAPAFARLFLNNPPSSERPFDIGQNAKGEPTILGLTTNTTDPGREERIELRVVLNWIEELKARVK